MGEELDEIGNLRVLVDMVAKRITEQIKCDEVGGLKEMLWYVPTNVLAEFVKR